MPRVTRRLIVLAVALLAMGCARGQPRDQRPLVIIPDLEVQKKYQAQGASPFFADGRMMRTPPEGTVARGTLKEDPAYYLGKVGETFVHNPLPLSRELLDRGRVRFNTFCSPCHDRTGGGKGIIVGYGLTPPPSFHDPRLRALEDGNIFGVITGGIRTMPPYARQVPVEDRWAIVAYVRALQRAQNATVADVPPEARNQLR